MKTAGASYRDEGERLLKEAERREAEVDKIVERKVTSLAAIAASEARAKSYVSVSVLSFYCVFTTVVWAVFRWDVLSTMPAWFVRIWELISAYFGLLGRLYELIVSSLPSWPPFLSNLLACVVWGVLAALFVGLIAGIGIVAVVHEKNRYARLMEKDENLAAYKTQITIITVAAALHAAVLVAGFWPGGLHFMTWWVILATVGIAAYRIVCLFRE